MDNQKIITCAFCKGAGKNPHFTGSCPVCKGRGKNQIRGEVVTCRDCRGSGQKRGTTLTCYDCGGVGVIPDTGETFRKAREEIREAQEEITRERPARNAFSIVDAGGEELTEKPKSKKHKLLNILLKRKDEEDKWEEEKGEEESDGKTHFCQCCGNEVNNSITIKICSGCFSKVKELRAYKE